MNPLIHPCTFDENRIAFALVGGPIDRSGPYKWRIRMRELSIDMSEYLYKC